METLIYSFKLSKCNHCCILEAEHPHPAQKPPLSEDSVTMKYVAYKPHLLACLLHPLAVTRKSYQCPLWFQKWDLCGYTSLHFLPHTAPEP